MYDYLKSLQQNVFLHHFCWLSSSWHPSSHFLPLLFGCPCGCFCRSRFCVLQKCDIIYISVSLSDIVGLELLTFMKEFSDIIDEPNMKTVFQSVLGAKKLLSWHFFLSLSAFIFFVFLYFFSLPSFCFFSLCVSFCFWSFLAFLSFLVLLSFLSLLYFTNFCF